MTLSPAALSMEVERLAVRRFAPSPMQVVAIDAIAGALAYLAALLLRFADEGSVPPSYATRIAPWMAMAIVVHLGIGWLMSRLRRPRSPLAARPVAPFAVGGLAAVLVVLAINYLLLPVPLRLPLSVAVIAPLLAATASAAARVAGGRPTIAPEDLLHRRIVHLDVEACAPAIRDKRVLITGAAGSIGSEIARQVLAIEPASVALLDTNESGLFDLESGLATAAGGVPLRALMADVTDARRLRAVFDETRPEVVFHAAAYKHVPLVESNPEGGFVTNVVGTLTVCQAAVAAGVERLVVISTDKAVKPSSFMGLTKRVAELIVAAVGQQANGTAISAVRFGNVLGSRGSVVPTLMRQIDAGGPVTITHPDVQRFFMTISEAASLVIRSAASGEPGAVYVLDMGEEMRIVDLAERLVRLKGLRPGRDVQFAYVGLRPGEKLREELADEHESLRPTDHPHVRRVEGVYHVDAAAVLEGVRRLDDRRRAGALRADDYPAALRALIDAATHLPAAVSA